MLNLLGSFIKTIGWYASRILSNYGFVITYLTYILILFTYYIGNDCKFIEDDEDLLNLIVVTSMFILIRIVSFLLKEASPIKDGIPIPEKRFTEVDKDSGLVTVERDRLQEMLLYMADLEDTIERKGML
mgnify:CR=1 FL=1